MVPGTGATAQGPGRLRWLRYLFFGRALPAVVFGIEAYATWLWLDAHYVHGRSTGSIDWLELTVGAVYLLFCAILVAIYLTRPVPRAADGTLPARLAALVALTVQFLIGILVLVVPALAGPTLYTAPPPLRVASGILVITATAVAIVTMLRLGRNFSIMPEARRLVTSGPYSRVRHPLYLAEITAALARTLGPRGGTQLSGIVAVALLIGLQVARTHYEERLLRATFPEYAGYAARTSRILPGVW